MLYDYIIIGSGFGGSVSAMRLAEKGYSVLVIEKGKRFQKEDFPTSDWSLRKFLWAPVLRWFGFQKLTFFRQIFILSGVGVGGGSIVYANTHLIPKDAFFVNPIWAHLGNWKEKLMPFYDKARFMLGTVPYEDYDVEDNLLKEIAVEMGQEETFSGVHVGTYFGDTENPRDPYFKGQGPLRLGCTKCAGCMVGCRFNAKNTLDKNYLYFAEKFGAEILPETLATKIEFENGEYRIHTRSSIGWFKKQKNTFRAKGLIVSGGVLGSMKLLLEQKYKHKTLPKLSDKLGHFIRTNSESICGITCADQKLNNGIAITSHFQPDENTHVEVVKYNDASGAMGRLAVLATGPGNGFVRTAKLIGQVIAHPIRFLKSSFHFRNWGKDSLILLVMQTLDESMQMIWKKGLFRSKMKLDNSEGNRVPAYIPVGQEVLHRYAQKVNGVAQNAIIETLFDTPITAHILGGCPMGEDGSKGMVNEKFEVHNYPNMYVLDGSIIPCNPGVNPSLTITALSEYAMNQIPEKSGNTQKSLEELMGNVDG